MGQAVSELGRKALAVAILVAVAYLAFKLVVGALTAIFWVVVAAVAVVAAVWALRTL